MAEVPDLKNYIRKLSGGGGSESLIPPPPTGLEIVCSEEGVPSTLTWDLPDLDGVQSLAWRVYDTATATSRQLNENSTYVTTPPNVPVQFEVSGLSAFASPKTTFDYVWDVAEPGPETELEFSAIYSPDNGAGQPTLEVTVSGIEVDGVGYDGTLAFALYCQLTNTTWYAPVSGESSAAMGTISYTFVAYDSTTAPDPTGEVIIALWIPGDLGSEASLVAMQTVATPAPPISNS